MTLSKVNPAHADQEYNCSGVTSPSLQQVWRKKVYCRPFLLLEYGTRSPGLNSYRAKCKHVYQGDLCDHWKKRPSQHAPKMPLSLLFAVSSLILVIVRIQSDFCYCQYRGILFYVKIIITCDILNFIAPPHHTHTHCYYTPNTRDPSLSASLCTTPYTT